MTVTTIENTMLPTYFTTPLLNPPPGGLFAAVTWTEETGAPRWLGEGVAFRGSVTGNFGGELASGVWGADWCASPDGLTTDDLKAGVRPDDPDPFEAITAWAVDACDLTSESRAEVLARAQQVLRMRERVLVARQFATRLVADAGVPVPADDLVEAVGEIEAMFAEADVFGVIHASAGMAASASAAHVAIPSGAGFRSPLGHVWIFDGGYRPVLGDDLLIATSAPLHGWRDAVAVRETIDAEHNVYAVVAERSVVIGYEAPLGAAWVNVPSI